jgi:hypothetical protein
MTSRSLLSMGLTLSLAPVTQMVQAMLVPMTFYLSSASLVARATAGLLTLMAMAP